MRPTIALTALLILPLAGCDPLDRLMGKSPSREYIETRQALLAPAPPVQVAPPAVPPPVIVPVPVVQPAPEPPPVIAPIEPPAPAVCQAIFRVLSCGDNGEWIWL